LVGFLCGYLVEFVSQLVFYYRLVIPWYCGLVGSFVVILLKLRFSWYLVIDLLSCIFVLDIGFVWKSLWFVTYSAYCC